mgnify:CR=1 FL=1
MKVLVAKPGLDGHDRGAKVVAQYLKDQGFDVVYSGLHRSPEQIVELAKRESVDVIGLSILSGAYLPICERLFSLLKAEGLERIPIVVGGVIRKEDYDALKALGVAQLFPSGTPLEAISDYLNKLAKKG